MSNGEVVFGGLHDYINELNKESLIKYILDSCLKKRELLEEEKFNSLVSEKQLKKENIAFLSKDDDDDYVARKLIDYIYLIDRDTLKRWALTAEFHHNKVTNNKFPIKEVFDTMTPKEFAEYTLEKVKAYPGLDDSVQLDKLSELYKILDNPLGEEGGLSDYIFRENRETLIKWALTVETHNQRMRRGQNLPKLHDEIHRMTNSQIGDYVLKMSKLYKEIDSGIELDSYAIIYETIETEDYLEAVEDAYSFVFGEKRKNLIIWALTCEYHQAVENKVENFVSVLRSEIDIMNDKQLVDYILLMFNLFPDLGSKQSLDDLSKRYEIQYESQDNTNPDDYTDNIEKDLKFLSEPVQGGEREPGLIDFLTIIPRDTLIRYAFAVERYDHEISGIHIRGGIADYIDELFDQEIQRFIKIKINIHVELNNREFVDALVYKYGF